MISNRAELAQPSNIERYLFENCLNFSLLRLCTTSSSGSPDRLGDFVFVFVDLAIVSLAQGVEVDLGEYAIEVFDDIPVIQIQHRLAQSAVIRPVKSSVVRFEGDVYDIALFQVETPVFCSLTRVFLMKWVAFLISTASLSLLDGKEFEGLDDALFFRHGSGAKGFSGSGTSFWLRERWKESR